MKMQVFSRPLPMVPERRRSVESNPHASVWPNERRNSAATNGTSETFTIGTYGEDTLRSKMLGEQVLSVDLDEDNSTIATQSMTVPFKAEESKVQSNPTKTNPLLVMAPTSEDSSEKSPSSGHHRDRRERNSTSSFTEDSIRAHLVDLYDDFDAILRSTCHHTRDAWTCFFEKYYKTGFCWVRASGNPVFKEGLVNMFVEDLEGISFKLVSIDRIQMLADGKVAVVTVTADQTFRYKGVYNADRTIVSAVLEWVDGDLKIAHEHRCKGVPIPSNSRWNSDN